VTDTYPVELRRRTLAGTIRYLAEQVCLAVPDDATRLALSLALESAAERAETQQRQGEIYYRQAADRERAVAAEQRILAELDRLTRLLPDPDGPLDQYADGARHVIAQISHAIGEELR
jgi:hypothetical protein